MTDNLRAAYYDGDKSIYSLDTVSQDFDIGLGATNYVLVGLITVIMLWNLVIIIFNCVHASIICCCSILLHRRYRGQSAR